jgi:hypothetical protein
MRHFGLVTSAVFNNRSVSGLSCLSVKFFLLPCWPIAPFGAYFTEPSPLPRRLRGASAALLPVRPVEAFHRWLLFWGLILNKRPIDRRLGRRPADGYLASL